MPSVYRRGVRPLENRLGLGILLFIIAIVAFAGLVVFAVVRLFCRLRTLLLFVFHLFITSGLVFDKNVPLPVEKSDKIML